MSLPINSTAIKRERREKEKREKRFGKERSVQCSSSMIIFSSGGGLVESNKVDGIKYVFYVMQ
jgi:hypothetical protein